VLNVDYASVIILLTIGDADKLRRDFGVNAASCLELSYLARAVDQQWATTKGLISLTRLVKAYEDRNLKKPKYIQLSNWESSLTEEQQDCEFPSLSIRALYSPHPLALSQMQPVTPLRHCLCYRSSIPFCLPSNHLQTRHYICFRR
jgi:hypothetical protein